MLVQQVLILLWKYLLVKEEELLYGWKVSKFRLAALFANARRVDASKLRVENTAILRLQPRKLILLLFWKIKGFLREHLTSDYLSTLKLFMDKKWRKSIFQLLPLDGRYFLTVALKRERQEKKKSIAIRIIDFTSQDRMTKLQTFICISCRY